MIGLEDAVRDTIARASGTGTIAALRPPRAYSHAWIAVLLVADVLAFLYSSYFATFALDRTLDVAHFLAWRTSWSIFVALWIAIFALLGLYRRSFALSVRDEIYFVVVALSLGTLPQMTLFTVAPQLSTSRAYILIALAFAIVLVSATRASLHAAAAHRRQRGTRPRIVLASQAGFDPQALADMGDVVVERVENYNPAEILRLAVDKRATAVIVGDPIQPPEVQYLRNALAVHKIGLFLAPQHLVAWDYDFRARRIGEQIVLETRPLRVCTPAADLTKRLMDVALSLIAITVSAPVMAAAALAILIDDGLPVFFRQARAGKNGVPFEIIKFRTMRTGAPEAYAGGIHSDPRVTRVGAVLRRLSIDELPQFFNVLRGEMSVVGPRPEMLSYAERYALVIPRYREIQAVRPGITCWGAVYMSRVIDESDVPTVIAHDLFYLQHWSPLLDLTIVLKTAVEVLFHRHD